MKRIFVLVSLILVTIAGCINVTQPPPSPAVTPPAIVAFSASPAQMKAGESATLLWNVTGATSVTIDQGIGTVAAAGTKAVSPTKTTTYTLTATNSTGTTTQPVTLTISGISIMPGLERRIFPVVTLTETVYDFINEAPSASWLNTDGPVKFADNDIYSVIHYHNDALLEDNVRYPRTLTILFKKSDFVQGTYPEVTIPQGAHFVAKVGYVAGTSPDWGVKYCASFIETSSGNIKYFDCINAKQDGKLDAFDIDLSSIVGKKGRFALRASLNCPSCEVAEWVDAKMIR
jgi:hypothetical protein